MSFGRPSTRTWTRAGTCTWTTPGRGCLPELAVITRPGAASRRGETASVANIGQDNEAKQIAALGSTNAPTTAPSPEDSGDVELITLTNDNQTRPINKPHVKLVGSNNSVVFTGIAQQLEIEGSNNDVEIDQVTKVIFHGSNNDVTYKQPLSSGEVVSEAHGSNNDVEKAD